ncbi:ribonuclease E activity regulator RraA [Sedimenticola sp.]|uniref:ribonuclease E activity regulator RraA n=1 Tax=Sedimenticola sp. TaxID=1940285 RepID=UPI003D0A9E63
MTQAPTALEKTADIYDEHESDIQVCEPLFRDYGGHARFSGEIVTIKCFEDNSLVRELLGKPGHGRVLVVDAGGSLRCAMLGDILAQKGVDNGWAGVLMYGCIRDAKEISSMPLGVKALATIPKKSVKKGVGEADIPVTFAQVTFRPGDWLYADEDGVVVLPMDE